MAGTTCPVCGRTGVPTETLEYPVFRHMDFHLFHAGPTALASCPDCGAAFRVIDDGEIERISVMYKGIDYAAQRERGHKVFVAGEIQPKSPHQLQADLLVPLLPDTKAAILDIGCADAALLMEMAERTAVSDLCGFDVNPHHDRVASTSGRVRFISGDTVATIEGVFDLIILSHSIQYIRDVAHLVRELRRLLKPAGAIFIQVPDFACKPASLLYGDLYFHYTAANLRMLAKRHGFSGRELDNAYFSRDVLYLLQMSKGEPSAAGVEVDKPFHAAVASLRNTAENIRRLEDKADFGVLGTTIEAAMTNSILVDRLAFFVDENPEKVGNTFLGKPVVHPRDVDPKFSVLLPYGDAAADILRRFDALYPGRYIAT